MAAGMTSKEQADYAIVRTTRPKEPKRATQAPVQTQEEGETENIVLRLKPETRPLLQERARQEK